METAAHVGTQSHSGMLHAYITRHTSLAAAFLLSAILLLTFSRHQLAVTLLAEAPHSLSALQPPA